MFAMTDREFLEGLHSKPVALSVFGDRGVIVAVRLADYEGSGGSSLYLLSENGGKLIDTFGGSLSVASHRTNGRYDLLLDTGSVAEPAQSTWVWDGTQYRETTSHPLPPTVAAPTQSELVGKP